jgi:two-component system LytT family sensor kinase
VGPGRRGGGGGGGGAPPGTGGTGIGTANTRARLAQLYGHHHALEIAPAEGGGTRVSLRLPWHDAPLPARALSGTAGDGAEARPRRRGWLGWAAAAVFFLGAARLSYASMLGTPMPPHRILGPGEALVCGTLSAAMITLLVAGAFAMAGRAPLVAGARAHSLRRHARAALLLGVAGVLPRNVCTVFWGTPLAALATGPVLGRMAAEVVKAVFVFAILSLVAHALEYARRARMTEAAGLRLQASLARAELQRTAAELRGLRMQVNPGFLFTALGAVAARVHRAPAQAERMVVRLADLLRQAMAATGGQEVPLEEEMRAAEPFLEVERIRLGGRLRVVERVDDDALECTVPAFTLQPLLENAIRHAVAPHAKGACVTVEISRTDDAVEIAVDDDGPGADVSAVDGAPGLGLRAIRQRLRARYGDAARMTIRTAPGAGFGVRIRVPVPARTPAMEAAWSSAR